MKVEFHKTGERRYSVIILREGLPKLEMNPAPGFDVLMPHDLLHFLVEQELGLQKAIFGQAATGGTVGTFQLHPSEAKNSRNVSRQSRKIKQKGEKMLKGGIDECAQSERATYVCLQNWYANSTDENLRSRAEEMKDSAKSVLGTMSKTERKKLNKEKLAEIRRRMNELSKQWSSLKVGQSLSLKW